MTITYKTNPAFPGINFPVLHRVHYRRHDALRMRAWLEANCKAPYYTSPGWTGDFVEFEDDEDAVLFALRWR